MYRIDYAYPTNSNISSRSHLLAESLKDAIEYLKNSGCIILKYIKL